MEDLPNSNQQSEKEARIREIEEGVNAVRKAIIRQNEVIVRLSEKVIELTEEIKKQKTTKKNLFFDSTGNKGVNQSINNQSTINENTKKICQEIESKRAVGEYSIGNEGVQEPLAQVKLTKRENNLFNLNEKEVKSDDLEQIKAIKARLNTIFKKISRQELKTFLVIYELEEKGLNPTYKLISAQMVLSEHCIRAHVCSLIKKGAPLEKTKLNNRLTLIFVKKDFKMLNLKERILTLYYKTDPNQTTLLDIEF